jgi:type III pantothenate kinase
VGKPECLLPVEPRVDPGTRVGPDRLANAAAAFDRYGGDSVVVDFGTATNFDVVAKDGAYVGGVIAPGVNLSLEALHLGAAALPHVDITQPERVIGTNTVACIQSGVFWGYVGLIQGITQRIRDEYGAEMKIIGTGGLAPLFAQGEVLFDTIDDDLTMHGLTVIHAHNKDNGTA